jgi:hypothetical protein
VEEETMSARKNNFGNWLNIQLHNTNKTQVWLEDKAKLSPSSICRWTKGSIPQIDNYFAAVAVIAKLQKRELKEVIHDTLEFMPYLVSYKINPIRCPTCLQVIKNE